MSTQRTSAFPKVNIGGIPIDAMSRQDLVAMALQDALANKTHRLAPKLVFDANGQAISLAATNDKYRTDLLSADIIHADGGALVSYSKRFTASPIPERSATTDMIHDIAEAFSKHGLTFFLLGAEEDVNRTCATLLESKYPGLRIAGRHHGFFNDLEVVAEAIRASQADLVWVGLGKPLEQEVARKLKPLVTASWLITCGGCFNFITGKYKRAPMWMQRINMEWLHRMVSHPRKLFWRYAITNPHALYLMLRYSDTKTQANSK